MSCTTIERIEKNTPYDYLIVILEIEKKYNRHSHNNPPRQPSYSDKHTECSKYSIKNFHICIYSHATR